MNFGQGLIAWLHVRRRIGRVIGFNAGGNFLFDGRLLVKPFGQFRSTFRGVFLASDGREVYLFDLHLPQVLGSLFRVDDLRAKMEVVV